jgi:uncharacterized protein (TIGR00369 family)
VEFEHYDQKVADALLDGFGGMLSEGIMGYMGIRHTAVGPGTLSAELEVREEFLNPFGTMHGGVLTALIDHVLGSVMYPVIPRGAWAATTEFKVNLTAPTRSGVLRADAEVVSMTRNASVVQVRAVEVGEKGERLVGLAQGSCTIKLP